MKPSEMTDEQLNLAILEKLGWELCPAGHWHLPKIRFLHVKVLPNYTGDLVAAMGLEEEICKDLTGRLKYIQALQGVIDWVYNDTIDLYDLIHATARQRSEAWLTARRK